MGPRWAMRDGERVLVLVEGAYDEAKHPRGPHGHWKKGIDLKRGDTFTHSSLGRVSILGEPHPVGAYTNLHVRKPDGSTTRTTVANSARYPHHPRGKGDDAFITHPEDFDQATAERELSRLADETQGDLEDLHRGVGPGGLTDTQDQRAGELDRRLEDIAAARRRNLSR